jgi:hypothetical protein
MTSPARNAARDAGESRSTPMTMTPAAAGRASALASYAAIGSWRYWIPSRPRTTFPLRNCGSTALMVLIGMANPIPAVPFAAPASTAAVMPTTSPWTLISGPPEFRGLIEALRAVGHRIAADDHRLVGPCIVAQKGDLDGPTSK